MKSFIRRLRVLPEEAETTTGEDRGHRRPLTVLLVKLSPSGPLSRPDPERLRPEVPLGSSLSPDPHSDVLLGRPPGPHGYTLDRESTRLWTEVRVPPSSPPVVLEEVRSTTGQEIWETISLRA